MGGKFVGGVDIVCELVESQEFDSIVPATARKPAPQEEVKELLA